MPAAGDILGENMLPHRIFRGLRADLHIHSVLSPCAEREMTPGNIVSMAMLLELDLIAVTDHQSCGNCAAVMAISEAMSGPLVIPGMEVESAEEIHLLCLFPDLESVCACEAEIRASMPFLPNRVDIFGEQWVMDENDEKVSEESRMLLLPSSFTCDQIAALVISLGGVCIPAHLDREANSMLVSLGTVPPDFPTGVIELSQRAEPVSFFRKHPELCKYQYLVNSDAHSLETMAAHALKDTAADICQRSPKPEKPTVQQVIQALQVIKP